MSTPGGPDGGGVDVEAILISVRESVSTAVAIQVKQLKKEMAARLDTTIYEVRQLSCKMQNFAESRGLVSGSFRSAARSDPGGTHAAQLTFTKDKRHTRKSKSKKRGEPNQSLYQLNDLLFDEILKSKQLVRKQLEDGQDYGAASRKDSAQSSVDPGSTPAGTCAKYADEVPAADDSPAAPVSALAEEELGVAQDHPASDPERSVALPMTLEEAQEVAVDLPGAPEQPPPLMPIVPESPELEVAGRDAQTNNDSGDGSMACKQYKATGRVRREGAEAIVHKAICSSPGELVEEEYTSPVPFVNLCFGKTHILRATLLFSCVAGLCARLPIKVASWPNAHFLRECSLFLYAAAAAVGSYMVNDANAVAQKMMTWASAHHIGKSWCRVARVCRRRSCQCWLLMLACALVTEVLIIHPEGMKNLDLQTQEMMTLFVVGEVLSLFAFVVASYFLVCSAFFQAHLLIGLDLFIDKWCCDLLDDANFEQGVSSWNTVQAFIRRVGNAIDNSLSVVLMGAFLGCGTFAVRAIAFGMQPSLHWGIVIEICSSLPLLSLVILAGTVLVQCSGISEKCAILPSLINQISQSDDLIMDQDRQYLVCYLTNSAAGIYVKGVKLTMTIVVKTAHGFGVALFAVLGLAVRMSV